MHAVLKLKCFPVGMELFPAIDRKQFDHIKSVIDECDYYLLIIGARYGSMDNKGISYTEKEYNYAVRKGIPVIAFLHSDIQSLPLGKTDDDKVLREKLEKFRNKVKKGRLVRFWKSADDLEANVISSLVDVFEKQPRNGWMKSTLGANGDLQNDIGILNKINTKNKNEIKRLKADLKKKDKVYNNLETSYKDSQQKINHLEEQIRNNIEHIKALETDLIKYKNPVLTVESKSQPQTESFSVNGVSFKMIHVEGGTFMMGANEDD